MQAQWLCGVIARDTIACQIIVWDIISLCARSVRGWAVCWVQDLWGVDSINSTIVVMMTIKLLSHTHKAHIHTRTPSSQQRRLFWCEHLDCSMWRQSLTGSQLPDRKRKKVKQNKQGQKCVHAAWSVFENIAFVSFQDTEVSGIAIIIIINNKNTARGHSSFCLISPLKKNLEKAISSHRLSQQSNNECEGGAKQKITI